MGWRFWIAVETQHAADKTIVGTVRGLERDGVVEIGRLAVATSHMRRGVGLALMHELEAGYPDAHAFTLFTGHNARAPLALYERLGYLHVRDELMPNGYRLVWLEKGSQKHSVD